MHGNNVSAVFGLGQFRALATSHQVAARLASPIGSQTQVIVSSLMLIWTSVIR